MWGDGKGSLFADMKKAALVAARSFMVRPE